MLSFLKNKDKAIIERVLCALKSQGVVIGHKKPVGFDGWYGYAAELDGHDIDVVITNPAMEGGMTYRVAIGYHNMISMSANFDPAAPVEVIQEAVSKKNILAAIIKVGFGKTKGRRIYETKGAKS